MGRTLLTPVSSIHDTRSHDPAHAPGPCRRGDRMRRRDFLTRVLSAPICALPRLAAAQPARRARLGWLSGGPEGQTEGSSDILKQTLQELGWKLGETLEVDERRA